MKNKMLKNMLIVSGIATLPVVNQFIKTKISKTKMFKQTITQISHELNQINITLSKYPIQTPQESQVQQQQLFNLIITPEIQKMLSKKAKNKVELIRKLKNDQNQNLITNIYLMALHSFGSLVHTPFFYWSALSYCFVSQLSFINDIYTLKTGNKLLNFPFKTIGQLYLKTSTALLLIFSMKAGIKKLGTYVGSKEIVKREP